MTRDEFNTRLLLLGVSCELKIANYGSASMRFVCHEGDVCRVSIALPLREDTHFEDMFTQITDALAEQEDKP